MYHLINFRIYKELYGKPLRRDWGARVVFLIQIFLIFEIHGQDLLHFWTVYNLFFLKIT